MPQQIDREVCSSQRNPATLDLHLDQTLSATHTHTHTCSFCLSFTDVQSTASTVRRQLAWSNTLKVPLVFIWSDCRIGHKASASIRIQPIRNKLLRVVTGCRLIPFPSTRRWRWSGPPCEQRWKSLMPCSAFDAPLLFISSKFHFLPGVNAQTWRLRLASPRLWNLLTFSPLKGRSFITLGFPVLLSWLFIKMKMIWMLSCSGGEMSCFLPTGRKSSCFLSFSLQSVKYNLYANEHIGFP